MHSGSFGGCQSKQFKMIFECVVTGNKYASYQILRRGCPSIELELMVALTTIVSVMKISSIMKIFVYSRVPNNRGGGEGFIVRGWKRLRHLINRGSCESTGEVEFGKKMLLYYTQHRTSCIYGISHKSYINF